MEVWPHSLTPEGNITAYAKVWRNGTSFNPYDVVVELRKATCNALVKTNSTKNTYISHT